MTGERVVRRLAAILATDVVGYSRLMGRDEHGTHTRLKAHRTERLEPTLARHGGRLVKLTGDGALVEFSSAVDALSAAIEFQQAMAEANRGQPEDTAIVFRTGLHVGDLIVDGDDLYGDGVNVAARLEAEAPPGGIVVSRAVREAVEGRLKAKLNALGELTLKNIERPIRAFRVEWDAADWQATGAASPEPVEPPPAASPTLALPDKPSIAVLPFQNMSGDPDQEYFADGMVEDIITALSRTKALFVIARNSSFTYKGRAVDVRQVGQELGVRYVLEGSVRKAGNKVRITGQLIEASSGVHIWADRLDGELEDIFELQEQVASRVVGALNPTLLQAEIERSRRKPTDDLQAYDLYLRGMSFLYKFTREANEEALGLFRRANSLDPTFALSFAFASNCHAQRWGFGWTVDRAGEIAEAEQCARQALDLDSNDPRVLAAAASGLLGVAGRVEESAPFLDRAVELDPTLLLARFWRANIRLAFGEPDKAIEDNEIALRLSPLDPRAFLPQTGIANAHFLAGRYDEGASWATKALQRYPHYLVALRILMASHALAGRLDEAMQAWAVYRHLTPTARILDVVEPTRLLRAEHREKWVQGLRLAGMPE